MEVDEAVLWLISALKLAEGPHGVDQDKVIQNVNNCFMRVKKERKASSSTESKTSEEIQDFQAKASVILLLCLPVIREHSCVKTCEGFQSMISSLPELSESTFFLVVRSQKIYFLMSPLLSWLPPAIITTLTKEYFSSTKDVTPLTLSVSVELLKSLIFSNQNRYEECNSQDYNECLALLVDFFSSKAISSENPSMMKYSGYFFMYLFECLYLLLTVYVGKQIVCPNTFACVETWTKLWKTNNLHYENLSASITKESIKSFLLLCHNNNEEVTVDMWMEWNEQNLPQNVTVQSVHQSGSKDKSIQVVICNIAFRILKLFDTHSSLEEELSFNEYHELLQFLKQVATDPDYDPDQDLTIAQLKEEIDTKDERQEKLIGLLIKKEGVVASNDGCTCLKEHGIKLDTQRKVELLLNCIEWIKTSKPYIPESINVILDLAADLSREDLLPIIEDSLSAGLDETLKTSSFKTQLTAVFNQLADENTAQGSEKHVWLCLQSGQGVVQQAVRLAITLPGLVTVMVQTLADLSPVCQAQLPSGNSLLVSTLVEWQASDLSEREEREFIYFVKTLLSVKGLLDTNEVLQLMIEPFMLIESNQNFGKLNLSLELLKEVLNDEASVVVKPGPAVVSLVLALVHIVDATMCLQGQEASRCLTVRSSASYNVTKMINFMTSKYKIFEREISLLKQMVSEYGLHPWSMMHISQVLDVELSEGSSTDLLLEALMKTSEWPQRDADTSTPLLSDRLKSMSKSQWIITLLQILPHCNENEWKSAIFITDQALQSPNTVYPVLEVFQGVLHLVCESFTCTSFNTVESHSLRPPVSLHHCFTFFASASIIFLEDKFKAQNSKEKFRNLANIFIWWCCSVSFFNCNPELPSMLLARLCGALEKVVVSDKQDVTTNKHKKTFSGENKKEAKSLPVNHIKENEINEDKENGQKMDIINKQTETYDIAEVDINKELEHITFLMVKYVPFSNLLASVASKLKKMYEL